VSHTGRLAGQQCSWSSQQVASCAGNAQPLQYQGAFQTARGR
jgi:hypothetical protein